jgi:hypothetical protein
MSIGIVKRGSDDVKEFNNKEDFINYYDNHKRPRNLAPKFCIKVFLRQKISKIFENEINKFLKQK